MLSKSTSIKSVIFNSVLGTNAPESEMTVVPNGVVIVPNCVMD
jgi:hypothetical protein